MSGQQGGREAGKKRRVQSLCVVINSAANTLHQQQKTEPADLKMKKVIVQLCHLPSLRVHSKNYPWAVSWAVSRKVTLKSNPGEIGPIAWARVVHSIRENKRK